MKDKISNEEFASIESIFKNRDMAPYEDAIIRNLKFTLDSEKIDTLYKDFWPIPLISVPSIRLKKTTENSVTITVNSNYEKNET